MLPHPCCHSNNMAHVQRLAEAALTSETQINQIQTWWDPQRATVLEHSNPRPEARSPSLPLAIFYGKEGKAELAQHATVWLNQEPHSTEEHTPSLAQAQILVRAGSLNSFKHPLAIQERCQEITQSKQEYTVAKQTRNPC